MQLKFKQPNLFFVSTDMNQDAWASAYPKKEFKAITKALPENVNVLSLETLNENQMLLRLEHIYENEEAREFSSPVTVELETLFTQFSVSSMSENM